jgi:hypothetical protein
LGCYPIAHNKGNMDGHGNGELGAVVVKVDEVEPNVFPAVETTDVVIRLADQGVEVVLVVRIEGKAVRVKVRLSRQKAALLRAQLEGVLG